MSSNEKTWVHVYVFFSKKKPVHREICFEQFHVVKNQNKTK